MQPGTILPTANEAWGFFGEIRPHADPEEAWRLAFPRIIAATGCSAAGVRDFLDSRHGRHFGDDVVSAMAEGHELAKATDQAVARWMGWRISRCTERETGIPRGLPYLTGFVTDCEIMAEAAA